MSKQEILYKIEKVRDKLRLYLILDDLMKKDSTYKLRCRPECPNYVEKDWNMLQLRIIYLEEKIQKYEDMLDSLT